MKRRYGKTERRFTKFFRRFISAKRRLGFMCLARYGKRKEGKPARLFLLQIKRYVFDSSKQTDFPIIKREIDNAWLCRLDAGSMECIFNFEKYQIKSCNSESVCFIIHDGIDFVITGGSDDFVLRVYIISNDCIITVYPYLGSEANAGLSWFSLMTSNDMREEIRTMLIYAYEQLDLVIRNRTLMEYEKIVLYLLIHIYLLFYNGTGKVGNKTSSQSFELINRFFELTKNKDALLHRNTAYFARQLNISVRYFFQICKNETGYSPKELINESVISEIRHIILTTNLSFHQISLHFGFSDQTAFTQYFKRNTGMTPSEFKKRYK